MSFRADRIYLEFLRLTRRLSNQQIMMLLAVVVGVLAGLGAYPVSYTHLTLPTICSV